jgi:hypothetical protein
MLMIASIYPSSFQSRPVFQSGRAISISRLRLRHHLHFTPNGTDTAHEDDQGPIMETQCQNDLAVMTWNMIRIMHLAMQHGDIYTLR